MLILARHGNTFGPGDPVVWVGAREDFPLAGKGPEQARMLGEALGRAGLVPDRAICGPLKRTRETLAGALTALGASLRVEIDARLTEIDYGAWGGLGDAEIADRFGAAALADWQARRIRPAGAGWGPPEADLVGGLQTLTAALAADVDAGRTVLVVTSNGVLRYWRELFGAQTESAGADKVGTGRLCLLDRVGGLWIERGWNLDPARL